MSEVCRLKDRLHASGEDSEELWVGHVRIDNLTAKCVSLALKTEQAKAEHYSLATHIRELDVGEATWDGRIIAVG